jgi:hypothetical protein
VDNDYFPNMRDIRKYWKYPRTYIGALYSETSHHGEMPFRAKNIPYLEGGGEGLITNLKSGSVKL